ncbi:PAS domain S-box protein [Pyxidicoccus sp. 3LFB2]
MSKPVQGSSPESATARPAASARVWLVDDSPTQLERARQLLAAHYAVETFHDAEEMLERLVYGPPPDMLVLDWQLPGVSGLEACRYVRELHDDLTLPILMLSTRGSREDFTQGLRVGASDYVSKPYDDAELLARVASLLRIRAQGQRLHEREAYLSTTLASIGDAVITTDRAGRITFLNPMAERVTGWSDAEARLRPLTDVFRIIDAQTRAAAANPVERVLAVGSRQTLPNHTLLVRKDGSEVPIEDSASPIRTDRGELTGAVLVFRDVTEQAEARQRSEALAARVRASEAEQSVLLDALPVLVSFVTADERYGRVNKAYEDWFGLSRESMRDRKVREVIGEAAYAVLSPMVKRGLAGERFSFEQHDVPYRLGGKRDVRVSFIPHRDEAGDVTGYVALLQDITPERRLERERQENARRQQQQAEFEQQLIGIVSHDLRNPLAAIGLTADMLLRQEDLGPRARKLAVRIQSSASRAARMVRDLLDFTQARLGGGIRIEPRPTDLHALSRTVVDEVEAAHPSVKVEVQASGNGQGLWDADRLSQVVQNLVTNAVTYAQAGTSVRVTTTGDGREATLHVHNEGAPISPEQLASIFKPLQRGTDAVDKTGSSVGLGLFIVKSIVEAHRGRIEVRSAAGEGTTFTVTLPQHPAGEPA